MPHRDFRVIWEIDVRANSPRDAAKQAWKFMRGHFSTANCFDVYDDEGIKSAIDLQEEEETK